MKKDFHAVSECLHQMAFPHISCSPALAPGAVCCVQLGRGSSFPVQLGFFYGTWNTGERFHNVRLRQFLQCKSLSRGRGRVSSCTAETAPCVQRALGCCGIPQRGPQSPTHYIHSASRASMLLQRMRCFSQSLWYRKNRSSQPAILQRRYYLLTTKPSFQ